MHVPNKTCYEYDSQIRSVFVNYYRHKLINNKYKNSQRKKYNLVWHTQRKNTVLHKNCDFYKIKHVNNLTFVACFVFSASFSSSKDDKSLFDSSAKRAMLTFQKRRRFFNLSWRIIFKVRMLNEVFAPVIWTWSIFAHSYLQVN
jgi:hypothetical protein